MADAIRQAWSAKTSGPEGDKNWPKGRLVDSRMSLGSMRQEQVTVKRPELDNLACLHAIYTSMLMTVTKSLKPII